MSSYKLPNVSSKYGAPMGRNADGTGTRERCRLFYVPFVDGDYDQGGAYWGSPANLWACLDDDLDPIAFVRARDRAAAYAAVVEAVGPVKLAKPLTLTEQAEKVIEDANRADAAGDTEAHKLASHKLADIRRQKLARRKASP